MPPTRSGPRNSASSRTSALVAPIQVQIRASSGHFGAKFWTTVAWDFGTPPPVDLPKILGWDVAKRTQPCNCGEGMDTPAGDCQSGDRTFSKMFGDFALLRIQTYRGFEASSTRRPENNFDRLRPTATAWNVFVSHWSMSVQFGQMWPSPAKFGSADLARRCPTSARMWQTKAKSGRNLFRRKRPELVNAGRDRKSWDQDRPNLFHSWPTSATENNKSDKLGKARTDPRNMRSHVQHTSSLQRCSEMLREFQTFKGFQRALLFAPSASALPRRWRMIEV